MGKDGEKKLDRMAQLTLDREAYLAMHFLTMQAETKSWMEDVLEKPLTNKDLYTELRSGVVLCSLMNKLFPGAIRSVHKPSNNFFQLENIQHFLVCLKKTAQMKEDELFEPLDLFEKKNMVKVFKCLYSFAEIVSGKKIAKKWKRKKDTDISWEEIEQWKKDYGDIEMEFDKDSFAAAATDAVEIENVEVEEEHEVFDVLKADVDDFDVGPMSVKQLGVTLEELIEAVDKAEDVGNHDMQETGDLTQEASMKAAQYAAQVKALGAQSENDAYRQRLAAACERIDEANGAMVDRHNEFQEEGPDSKGKKKEFVDACEHLKKVARDALDEAERRPARLARPEDFKIRGDVTDADIDVSLSELVRSVRKVQDKDGVKPSDTSVRTEEASRKAAKFAAQVAKVGAQNRDDHPKFADKLDRHAEAIQEANAAMVEKNNAYVDNPGDPAAWRELDEACEELIRVATGAAKDAKNRPPKPVKVASADDYDIDGTAVTSGDLKEVLMQVIKAANNVEGFPEHTAHKTAENTTECTAKAAKLTAMVRAVGKAVKEPKDLKKRIEAAAKEVEKANEEVVNANNEYTEDTDNDGAQRRLKTATKRLKEASAAAVKLAEEGIEAMKPKVDMDDENLKDIDPETQPLHFATLKGDLSAVKDLIGKGHKIDPRNAQGWTPLYTAAYVGNLDLVRFFVEQGADINVRNGEGWTPLFAAVSQGHKHVVKPVIEEYNAEINVQSNQGTTPVYHAAEGGRYTITRMLIDNGADLNLGKKGGWLPIHGAVYNYHGKVTRLLVQSGADVNRANDELKQYTPLHIAISTKKPHPDIIDELIGAKADIDAQNKNGSTPVALAALWGHDDVIKKLHAAGADLHKANNKGRTPLEVAVRNDNKKTAKLISEIVGKAVPSLKAKKTAIGSIEAPDAPPPPPEDE